MNVLTDEQRLACLDKPASSEVRWEVVVKAPYGVDGWGRTLTMDVSFGAYVSREDAADTARLALRNPDVNSVRLERRLREAV